MSARASRSKSSVSYGRGDDGGGIPLGTAGGTYGIASLLAPPLTLPLPGCTCAPSSEATFGGSPTPSPPAVGYAHAVSVRSSPPVKSCS